MLTTSHYSPRTGVAFWNLVLAIVILFAYATSLDGPFLFDDQIAIIDNRSVHSYFPFDDRFSGRPIRQRLDVPWSTFHSRSTSLWGN